MTLSEKATEALRLALIDGSFKPGASITEREACDFLGMSRSPVRTAFQTLANEGLLLHESRRGYRIRRISSSTIAEAYQVRAALEGLAARVLARSGISPQTDAMFSACVEHGRSMLAGERAAFEHHEWREMNQRFHRAILQATDNEPLQVAFQTAARHPLASLHFIPALDSEPDFPGLQQAQTDHELIVDAIRSRDTQRAAARMQEHVELAGEYLLRQLRQCAPAVQEVADQPPGERS